MVIKWCIKLDVAKKRCPIVFQCHPSNFKVTRLKKIVNFDPNWVFPDCNSSLNLPMAMKLMHKAWSNIGEVPYWFSRSPVKFKVHTGQKIADFVPHWAFPDCNSSLNSPMALKWYTKLNVVKKRCRMVFQGHLSNFKVTQDKKSPILTRIECFRTVNQVWFHWWILNDAQSLMFHRTCALLFSKVIHQISRSPGTKYHQFRPELRVSGPWLQFEFPDGFEMMHKAWCSIEEVLYSFSRSSIKFQGHTG